MYKFITEYNPYDSTVKQYVRYLESCIHAAKANLAKPVVTWPNGSSHEISMMMITECESAYADIVLEHGLFDAHGRLVDFEYTKEEQ